MNRTMHHCLAIAMAAIACNAHAQLTELSNVPLETSTAGIVKPNLMLILDTSGSMGSKFMPDDVENSNIEKPRCVDADCALPKSNGVGGSVPTSAYRFNTIYYNPNFTYTPALNRAGVSMSSYNTPALWAAAPKDPFTDPTDVRDLVNAYPGAVYCNQRKPDVNDSKECKANGEDTPNPFVYNSAPGNVAYPDNLTSKGFRFAYTRYGNPFYFEINPVEYCTNDQLIDCQALSRPSSTHRFPAYVRWCTTEANRNAAGAVSGIVAGVAKRKRTYSDAHTWPRYGRFERFEIKPGGQFTNRPDRFDCARAPSCTYAEEMTNFANWYAYYSIRINVMKTVISQSFNTLNANTRVGLVSHNTSSPVAASEYQPISDFTPAAKGLFFDKLFAMGTEGGTPLRRALSRVGRHFAGKTDGVNAGMPQDPIQFSCQKNVAMLVTDGYWNGPSGLEIDGTYLGNHDNVEGEFTSRADGVFDGARGGSDGTLADVALYYYANDLRPAGSTNAAGKDVSEDNVPTSLKDKNNAQHMVTYTLGLGLDGLMTYRPNYDTATTGDFYSIKTGRFNCPWITGACDWPEPQSDSPSALDDLWHAAVSGRGRFYSAKDPDGVRSGMFDMLNSLRVVTGSSSASATSSPIITKTTNAIYSAVYRSGTWDGEMVKQNIDLTTGEVLPPVVWSARTELERLVAPKADSRTIYTFGATALKAFKYSALTATERAWLDNKCPALSQCATLNPAEEAQANSGTALVDYLRGQTDNEGSAFRAREFRLGDIVNSVPVHVAAPNREYIDAGYAAFKTTYASRESVLYFGANSGMLHAIDADTGVEKWAYVPRQLMPNLHKLADAQYSADHRYFVDGAPVVSDVYDPVAKAWRTILVAGFNAGGRGYFALDITNPNNPRQLWEVCSDSTVCAISSTEIGFSYGNPIIFKQAGDNTWQVAISSGYNNVAPGSGRAVVLMLDALTGAIERTFHTYTGSTARPAGLGRLTAVGVNSVTDGTATEIYAGDLLGNVWRFSTDATGLEAYRGEKTTLLATLTGPDGKPQSIMARPEAGYVTSSVSGSPPIRVVYVGTGRYLGVSDLKDPATLGPVGFWSSTNSIYAIRDYGDDRTLAPRTDSKFVVQTVSTSRDGLTRTPSSKPVTWAGGTHSGWYFDLPTPGERLNLDARLILGTLVAITNVPTASECSYGGDAWLYQINYQTGSIVPSASTPVFASKLTGAVIVGTSYIKLPDGSIKVISTAVSGEKATRGLTLSATGASPRRTGWREIQR